MEAALIGGLTSVGLEASIAVSAVVIFRLATFWLPLAPGWFATDGGPPITRHDLYLPCKVPIMTATGDLRVSSRGQMSLPSSARHRWGLDDGGAVGYLDLGDAIVIVPGGTAELRRELLEAVSAQDWDQARQGFGDDELANE